jgi:excisionase family DNA binding protein
MESLGIPRKGLEALCQYRRTKSCTVPEIATLLKVVDKTVYTMAQKAEIPAFKVRGQWRFRRVDIDSWVDLQLQLQRRSESKEHQHDHP